MRIAFSSCIFNFNYDVLFARSRFRKLLQFLRALPAGETPAGFVYIFLQYHYITPVRGSQMQNKNFLPSRASAVSKLIRPRFIHLLMCRTHHEFYTIELVDVTCARIVVYRGYVGLRVHLAYRFHHSFTRDMIRKTTERL